MGFFTVRATLVDGERAGASWRFDDRMLAEEKFEEVCGPLCTEAWLFSWTERPSVRGKMDIHLQRYWSTRGGTDGTPKWLAEVNVFDDEVTQSGLGESEPRASVTSRHEVVPSESPEMAESTQQIDDLADLEIDFGSPFDVPPDDSNIYVFVDPEQFTFIPDQPWGNFGVSFRKVTGGRLSNLVRFPDFESSFRGLTFSCQWDVNLPGMETYAWDMRYRNIDFVGLKLAQRMAEMLEKVRRIEKCLPSRPRSFGEFVAMIAEGLGLNPERIAYWKIHELDGSQLLDDSIYLGMNTLELRSAVDRLIAKRRQAEHNKQKSNVFVVSDEAAIVEVIPSMFKKKGCEAFGSIAMRDHEWAYEQVLREAEAFQPDVLMFFSNCHLCPMVNGLDLPLMLIQSFPLAHIIITKVDDCISAKKEVLDYLRQNGRRFDIIDVPFEIDEALALIKR